MQLLLLLHCVSLKPIRKTFLFLSLSLSESCRLSVASVINRFMGQVCYASAGEATIPLERERGSLSTWISFSASCLGWTEHCALKVTLSAVFPAAQGRRVC
ncbi:hypothetical protein XENTR_v10004115 [Xenopus tropicalis]|nr:hypothetical protein XENTR_v10004115 [Xenopus tropicalis]